MWTAASSEVATPADANSSTVFGTFTSVGKEGELSSSSAAGAAVLSRSIGLKRKYDAALRGASLQGDAAAAREAFLDLLADCSPETQDDAKIRAFALSNLSRLEDGEQALVHLIEAVLLQYSERGADAELPRLACCAARAGDGWTGAWMLHLHANSRAQGIDSSLGRVLGSLPAAHRREEGFIALPAIAEATHEAYQCPIRPIPLLLTAAAPTVHPSQPAECPVREVVPPCEAVPNGDGGVPEQQSEPQSQPQPQQGETQTGEQAGAAARSSRSRMPSKKHQDVVREVVFPSRLEDLLALLKPVPSDAAGSEWLQSFPCKSQFESPDRRPRARQTHSAADGHMPALLSSSLIAVQAASEQTPCDLSACAGLVTASAQLVGVALQWGAHRDELATRVDWTLLGRNAFSAWTRLTLALPPSSFSSYGGGEDCPLLAALSTEEQLFLAELALDEILAAAPASPDTVRCAYLTLADIARGQRLGAFLASSTSSADALSLLRAQWLLLHGRQVVAALSDVADPRALLEQVAASFESECLEGFFRRRQPRSGLEGVLPHLRGEGLRCVSRAHLNHLRRHCLGDADLSLLLAARRALPAECPRRALLDWLRRCWRFLASVKLCDELVLGEGRGERDDDCTDAFLEMLSAAAVVTTSASTTTATSEEEDSEAEQEEVRSQSRGCVAHICALDSFAPPCLAHSAASLLARHAAHTATAEACAALLDAGLCGLVPGWVSEGNAAMLEQLAHSSQLLARALAPPAAPRAPFLLLQAFKTLLDPSDPLSQPDSDEHWAALNALLRLVHAFAPQGALPPLPLSPGEARALVERLLQLHSQAAAAAAGTRQDSQLLAVWTAVLLLQRCHELRPAPLSLELFMHCVGELTARGMWAADPACLVAASELLRVHIEAFHRGDTAAQQQGSYLRLGGLAPRHAIEAARLLGLLYYDLYGLPVFRSKTQPPPRLGLPLPDARLCDVVRFLRFLRDCTDAPRNDIRDSFRFLALAGPLRCPPQTAAGEAIRAYLCCGEPEYSAEDLVESFIEAEESGSTVGEDESGFSSLYLLFYRELCAVTAPGPSQINYRDCRATLELMEAAVLPRLQAFLCDLRFAPRRLAAWRGLFDCFNELFCLAADKVSECCAADVDARIHLVHSCGPAEVWFQPELSPLSEELGRVRALLTNRFLYVREPDLSLLAHLLLIKNSALTSARRVHAAVVALVSAGRSGHTHEEEEEGSALQLLENHAFMAYNTAAAHIARSPDKERCLLLSLQSFESLLSRHQRRPGTEQLSAFAPLMCGKLAYHFDWRRAAEALEMVGTAAKANSSAGSAGSSSAVDARRQAEGSARLLYQLHSIRLKEALRRLLDSEDSAEDGDTALLRWSFAPDSGAAAGSSGSSASREDRLWGVVLDALAGLRHCRKLDPYDFKSVYRISSFLFRAAQMSVPAWAERALEAVYPQGASLASATAEMQQLFDKRRAQVVALWAQESTACRFEQLMQRTAKFDALTKKYLAYYVKLLVLGARRPELVGLLEAVLASKKRTSVMDWMLDMALFGLAELLHAAAPRDLSDCLSALQACFRAYDSVKGRPQLNALADVEALLCRLMGRALSLDETADCGEVVLSEVVRFCRKRWPAKAATGSGRQQTQRRGGKQLEQQQEQHASSSSEADATAEDPAPTTFPSLDDELPAPADVDVMA